MVIDPTKIKIESHHPPIWEKEEDFGQVMSEQLKHAPWLALSLLAHLVVVLIAWVLLDEPKDNKDLLLLNMDQQEEEEELEEEVEEVEEVEEEDVIDEEVQEEEITEDEITENIEDVTDTVESAFDSDGWNTAVGLGGGAGGKWGGRAGGRKALEGKNRGAARAIDDGLQWLKDHQDDDGRWDADGFMKHDTSGVPTDNAGLPIHDVGVTALALLAYLGDGSTMRGGPYQDQVKDAVVWLRKQQGSSGLFGTANSSSFIYDHAIATYAMCEAYGLSKYATLRKNAEKGLAYLEAHRNPYAVWRYQPRDGDNDLSVTGWCIMAYKSAEGFGLEVNPKAMEYSLDYLDKLTDPNNGSAGYQEPGQPSSREPGDHSTRFPPEKGEAMTAVGLFCRFFLGQNHKDPENEVMRRAADTILSKPPRDANDGSVDHYYWYYASYALYQMGGTHWTQWSKALDPAVVKVQRSDGNFKGSWDSDGAWGENGGRVYSTAILVLTLEAFYRYTALIR